MSGEDDREERTKWAGRAWAGLLLLAQWLGLIEEGYERPESLAERAQVVTDALTDASDLLGELQAEVRARSAVIESLTAETEDAQRRAEDAARRASLDEEQAKAVDAYLDRALKNRLSALERSAMRREWVLATVVALIVGVASILISHFLFNF